MSEQKQLPGITRKAEEQKLSDVIKIAKRNLWQAEKNVKALTGELQDLLEDFNVNDKETQVF